MTDARAPNKGLGFLQQNDMDENEWDCLKRKSYTLSEAEGWEWHRKTRKWINRDQFISPNLMSLYTIHSLMNKPPYLTLSMGSEVFGERKIDIFKVRSSCFWGDLRYADLELSQCRALSRNSNGRVKFLDIGDRLEKSKQLLRLPRANGF